MPVPDLVSQLRRSSFALLLTLLSSALLLASPLRAEEIELVQPVPYTVSVSKQFRVYGEDGRVRGLFASFAEQQKNFLLSGLGIATDPWVHPIILRVEGHLAGRPHPTPIFTEVLQFGQRFGINLHVRLGANFSREALKVDILRGLIFEMALRDVEREVTSDRDLVPRWLLDGIPGALKMKRQGTPSVLFESLFRTSRLLTAEEILASEKPSGDSVSRSVYETSASGFVHMLLAQPKGSEKLQQYIRALGGKHASTSADLLRRFFPFLRGKTERMEKQWALYCSKLATPQVLEFQNCDETEASLQEALTVSFLAFAEEAPGEGEVTAEETSQASALSKLAFWNRLKPKKDTSTPAADAPSSDPKERKTVRVETTVDDFHRFVAREDRGEILQPCYGKLVKLSFHCFPAYRGLVNDYTEIVLRLRNGETKGIAKQLEKLAREREVLTGSFQGIGDYLDWFEVTQLKERSGAFEEFQRRANELQEKDVRRTDPISEYLGALESELK